MRRDLPSPESAAHFKSDRARTSARKLRKAMTPAECALWVELRRLPLKGTHFRSQAPFRPFVADFLCHRARLMIELDGGAHAALDVSERDEERQAWIESRRYRVLRFTNERVLADARGVATEIFAATPDCLK
jgi:very-short-patch-repair endonuclease